jgi:hypothetical protein
MSFGAYMVLQKLKEHKLRLALADSVSKDSESLTNFLGVQHGCFLIGRSGRSLGYPSEIRSADLNYLNARQ